MKNRFACTCQSVTKWLASAGCLVAAVFVALPVAAAITLNSPVDYSTVNAKSSGARSVNSALANGAFTATTTYFKKFATKSKTDGDERDTMSKDYKRSGLVTLAWSGAASGRECTVTIRRAKDGSVARTLKSKTGSAQFVSPEIGRNYTWIVSDGTSTSKEGHFFVAADAPRIINVSAIDWGISNARDLGGWTTSDGKVVKQGLVYRSPQFDWYMPGYVDPDDDEHPGPRIGAPFYYDTLGIGFDLDLRKVGDVRASEYVEYQPASGQVDIRVSPLGPDIPRFFTDYDDESAPFGNYSGIFDVQAMKAMHKGFSKVVENLKSGTPLVFHCAQGKDRTGSLAYVLNGLLGVPRDSLRLDWAWTYVADSSVKTTELLIDQIEQGLNKSPYNTVSGIPARLEKYVKACYKAGGSTEAQAASDIATLRAKMLETPETPAANPGGGSSDSFAYRKFYWRRHAAGGSWESSTGYWYKQPTGTAKWNPISPLTQQDAVYLLPLADANFCYADPANGGKIELGYIESDATYAKTGSVGIDTTKPRFSNDGHGVTDRAVWVHKAGKAYANNVDFYFDGTGKWWVEIRGGTTFTFRDFQVMESANCGVRFPEGDCDGATLEIEPNDDSHWTSKFAWFEGGAAGTRQALTVRNALAQAYASGRTSGVAGALDIRFELGANNTASSAAMLAVTGTLKVNAGSTLTVDAGQKAAGTYKLVACGTLTCDAALYTGANVVNCMSGTYGVVEKKGAALNLVIKSGTAPVTDKLATAPAAKSGLKYTGSAQTGVPAGTGYTISGNTATDAGNYQATVTLASGYQWSDGLASASRTVSWSIAKGANAWTENPSVTPSDWTAGSTPATIAFSNGANKFGAAVSCDTSSAVLKALAGGESKTVTFTAAASANWDAITHQVTVSVAKQGQEPDPAPTTVDWYWGRKAAGGTWSSKSSWFKDEAAATSWGTYPDGFDVCAILVQTDGAEDGVGPALQEGAFKVGKVVTRGVSAVGYGTLVFRNASAAERTLWTTEGGSFSMNRMELKMSDDSTAGMGIDVRGGATLRFDNGFTAPDTVGIRLGEAAVGATMRFTDGASTLGFLAGGNADAKQTLEIANATVRLAKSSGTTGPLALEIAFGHAADVEDGDFLNDGSKTALTAAETLAFASGSTLMVDAERLAEGTYTLVSAGTLTCEDAFVSQATVAHVGAGLKASVAKDGNTLKLRIENAAAEEEAHTTFDWLKTDGTGFFDTGVAPDQGATRVVMEVEFLSDASETALFGASSHITKGKGWDDGFDLYVTDAGRRAVFENWNNATGTGTEDNEFAIALGSGHHTFDASQNELIIDGMDYTATLSGGKPVAGLAGSNLFLFRNNEGSGQDVLKLYSAKIYEGNSLLHDYVPAKNAAGVACLYDEVTKTCLLPTDATAFAVGNGGGAPTIRTATLPVARTGLVYNGTEQTGVEGGIGCTVTEGGAAMTAGEHTAIVELAEGYQWPAEPKTGERFVSWLIAKGVNQWTVKPSVTPSSWTADAPPATITISNGATEFGTRITCDTTADALKGLAAGTSKAVAFTADADGDNYDKLTFTVTVTALKGEEEEPDYVAWYWGRKTTGATWTSTSYWYKDAAAATKWGTYPDGFDACAYLVQTAGAADGVGPALQEGTFEVGKVVTRGASAVGYGTLVFRNASAAERVLWTVESGSFSMNGMTLRMSDDSTAGMGIDVRGGATLRFDNGFTAPDNIGVRLSAEAIGATLRFTDGVNTLGFVAGGKAGVAETIEIANARVVLAQASGVEGPVQVEIALGEFNTSQPSLACAGAFMFALGSTLSVDAAQLPAGTYPLVEAASLAGADDLAASAMVANVKTGTTAKVVKTGATLALVIEEEAPTDPIAVSDQASWTAWMQGVDTETKLAAVKAAVSGKPAVKIAIANFEAGHDDFQVNQMTAMAKYYGLAVEIVSIEPTNPDAGRTLDVVYRDAFARGDIVIDYKSYWTADECDRAASVIENCPEKLFILPYGEAGSPVPPTSQSLQGRARHADGSGLANMLLTIPLVKGKTTSLTSIARRTEGDTQTAAFVSASGWAAGTGDTCQSASMAAIAAAWITAARGDSPSAAELIRILESGRQMPRASELEYVGFTAADREALQAKIDEYATADELGRRKLLNDAPLNLGGVLRQLPEEHVHNWGAWTTAVAATCEGYGYETRTCSAVGCADQVQRRTLLPLGHDWGAWEDDPADSSRQIRHCVRTGCDATDERFFHVVGDDGWGWQKTMTEGGDEYAVLVFTNVVDQWSFVLPEGVAAIDYVVVAGGGGGGAGNNYSTRRGGGGGGAGGLLRGTQAGTGRLIVSVGKGGAAGKNGFDSTLAFGGVELTAVGGGAGASDNYAGNAGGSGGGGGGKGSGAGGDGVAGQGNKGGSAGGGGGGYAAAGTNGKGGAGGAGYQDPFTGLVLANGGAGGTDGPTDTPETQYHDGLPGAPSTGNGGDGAYGLYSDFSGPTRVAGAGGSGVVIVRYLVPGGEPPEPTVVTTNAMANADWGYEIHGLGAAGRDVALVFTNAMADANMKWTAPSGVTEFDFLVVGGGGGGRSSGAGAGGVVTGKVAVVSSEPYAITVGAGGAAGGGTGGDSAFGVGEKDWVRAYGGAGGVGGKTAGKSGGCGSGAGTKGDTAGAATQGAFDASSVSSAVKFGCAGGTSNVDYGSAGGGGATEAGKAGSNSSGNKGGDGIESIITGESVWYAGGGTGGGNNHYGVENPGGKGGGGRGGVNADKAEASLIPYYRMGGNGVDGLGGGGGGVYTTNGGIAYSRGGSGVVVIRYTLTGGDEPEPQKDHVVPGAEPKAYATENEALAAAPTEVTPADAVKDALGNDELADYIACFTVETRLNAAGQWVNVAELTPAATDELQRQVNEGAVKVVEELAEGEVRLDSVTPGFYYGLEYGVDLKSMTTDGQTFVLATDATLTLSLPKVGASGFYRVVVRETGTK